MFRLIQYNLTFTQNYLQAQMLWQLNDITATNEIRQYTYGNGISTIANRDPFHHFTDITHGSLHQQIYDFEPSTGNLNSRRFNNFATSTNLYEQFTYDNLDRLTKTQQFTVNGQLLFPTANINNMSYDAIGNISHKDDAGNYVYNLPSKPYLLTSINNPAQNISLNTLNVQYADFRKVSQISEMGTNKQMNFTYGPEYERIKVDYSVNGGSGFTRYYGENFDRQETQTGYKEWDYIYGPTGLIAINYNNNGSSQLLYSLTDHLGSPILLTSNSQNPSTLLIFLDENENYQFSIHSREHFELKNEIFPLILKKPHLFIPVRPLMERFLDTPRSEKWLEEYNLLNEDEKKLLEVLRTRDFKQIIIKRDRQKDYTIDLIKDKNILREEAEKVRKILGMKDYSEVHLKQRNEKDIYFENTIRIK
jgi:hypothetical protein